MSTSSLSRKLQSEYDYIVIGGGTAGLVVATRLTEDPSIQVAVFEAGGNHLEDPRVNIPGMALSLHGTDLDWQFETAPQEALNQRQLKAPQGRLLGGSSGINNQVYVAPSLCGLDSWEALGNKGWNWKSMSQALRKNNTLIPPSDELSQHLRLSYLNPDCYGTDGPLQVMHAGNPLDPVGKAWVDTFHEMGFDVSGDPFSGVSLGGYSNTCSNDPKTKTRSYSANAYLAPHVGRENLHVFTGVEVEKIGLDTSDGDAVATHIEFAVGGEKKEARASKEIIVAAGALQSPKLLELSGIGSPSILEALGIKTIIPNAGVGENLQDHLMAGISLEVKPEIPTGDPLFRQEPEAIQKAMEAYTISLSGPLSVGGVTSYAYMPLADFSKETGKSADLTQLLEQQRISSTGTNVRDAALARIMRDPNEGIGHFFAFPLQWAMNKPTPNPENYYTVGVSQCYPFSRGSSHASSSKPTAKPTIQTNCLTSPIDLEIFARQVLYLKTLISTPPFSSIFKPGGKFNSETAAAVKDLDTAKKYLKEESVSTFHWCGTCAMLPREDGGVVDDRLVVYGTKNLRVVDSSIIPLIPRSNTQSTVYAIAERAADIIKGVL